MLLSSPLCTPVLRAAPTCEGKKSPWTAFWACPPGLLGLPGPQYCLPGPQYCLSWPSGRHLDAKWTPVGRQVGASWTAKTAASVNVRLKDAKTAAKSHRTPCQQYFCRRMATYAALVYIYIYILAGSCRFQRHPTPGQAYWAPKTIEKPCKSGRIRGLLAKHLNRYITSHICIFVRMY